MPDLPTGPVDTTTWPDFARVMEEHNGARGGCWCIAVHPARRRREESDSAYSRSDKEALVREGQAHAALVYDGPDVASTLGGEPDRPLMPPVQPDGGR
jgi:hypothetical protein